MMVFVVTKRHTYIYESSYHVIVKTKNFVRTKSFFKTSKRNPIMLKKQINQKNITLMEYFDYYDIVPIKIFFTLFLFLLNFKTMI